jgi:hypothetical protein
MSLTSDPNGRFNPPFSIHWIGDWLSLRAGLDVLEEEKTLNPAENRTPIRQVRSQVGNEMLVLQANRWSATYLLGPTVRQHRQSFNEYYSTQPSFPSASRLKFLWDWQVRLLRSKSSRVACIFPERRSRISNELNCFLRCRTQTNICLPLRIRKIQ